MRLELATLSLWGHIDATALANSTPISALEDRATYAAANELRLALEHGDGDGESVDHFEAGSLLYTRPGKGRFGKVGAQAVIIKRLGAARGGFARIELRGSDVRAWVRAGSIRRSRPLPAACVLGAPLAHPASLGQRHPSPGNVLVAAGAQLIDEKSQQWVGAISRVADVPCAADCQSSTPLIRLPACGVVVRVAAKSP